METSIPILAAKFIRSDLSPCQIIDKIKTSEFILFLKEIQKQLPNTKIDASPSIKNIYLTTSNPDLSNKLEAFLFSKGYVNFGKYKSDKTGSILEFENRYFGYATSETTYYYLNGNAREIVDNIYPHFNLKQLYIDRKYEETFIEVSFHR